MGKAKRTPEAELAGSRISQCLRDLGKDRKWLAERTGLGYPRLGNYEQGTRELGIREAKLIQRATGCPAAYLMGLIEEPEMRVLKALLNLKAENPQEKSTERRTPHGARKSRPAA